MVQEDNNVPAYVISLANRADRLRKFDLWSKQLCVPWSRLGTRIQPYIARPHPKGGQFGCWESHLNVMKQALASGAKCAIIFEDDAIPTPQANSILCWDAAFEEIDRIMTNEKDWELIALGCLPMAWKQTVSFYSKNVLKAAFLETHAYIASERFMRRFVELEPRADVGLDYVMALMTQGTSYALIPELFEQNDEVGSDIMLGKKYGNPIAYRKAYKEMWYYWIKKKIELPARDACNAGLITAANALLWTWPFLWARVLNIGAMFGLVGFSFVNTMLLDPDWTRWRNQVMEAFKRKDV
jgi:GR25 family glycosyltransferase involved in LPS biosynthesis